jgi:hypothetical protein
MVSGGWQQACLAALELGRQRIGRPLAAYPRRCHFQHRCQYRHKRSWLGGGRGPPFYAAGSSEPRKFRTGARRCNGVALSNGDPGFRFTPSGLLPPHSSLRPLRFSTLASCFVLPPASGLQAGFLEAVYQECLSKESKRWLPRKTQKNAEDNAIKLFRVIPRFPRLQITKDTIRWSN